MASSEELEVVSVQRIDERNVLVGVASLGRIHQFSQRAGNADPRQRGVVNADSHLVMSADQQPRTGDILQASYTSTGRSIEVTEEPASTDPAGPTP